MKALDFKISRLDNSAVLVRFHELPYFYDQLHYHKEWQITLIVKGEGMLFAGNGISRFEKGDLIVFSSNLPHLFKNDSQYYLENSPGVSSKSLFFNKEVLGENFLETPEMYGIKLFFEKAKYGLKINNESLEEWEAIFDEIKKTSGVSKISNFLSILNRISNYKKAETLSVSSEVMMNERESVWLGNAIRYTMSNYGKDIRLSDIASIANLSIPAFCRLFKLHTRKTYVQFLNEVRINFACEQLKKTNLTIAQVANHVGFGNLSNFNRRFKAVTGATPTNYLKDWTT